MSRDLSRRIGLGGLLLLALLLIGAGLGLRQPLNVDEERFLGVSLEMLQDGSWFIPHRAGEIYPDKPPLFIWAVASFVRLTGAPELALFLPALLAGLVATACLYDLGRRLWNRRSGVFAALLFLSTYQTFSILRAGQIDGFLCLWIVLGLYGLIRHLLLGPAWGWYYLACAAAGFGIISKGVGFLPILMLLPYFYAVRRGWSGVVPMPGKTGAWLLGLPVALAAIGVWLLPLLVTVALRGDADSLAYAREILLRQTAERYANAWAHREPFWYFFVEVIPKYWLPMVLALPWLIPAWRRQLAKRDGRTLLLLGWVALVLLFFCLSSGKRKLYIYPALPALALAVAPLMPWLLRRWFAGQPRRTRLFGTLCLLWFGAWFARGFIEPLKEGSNPHAGIMHQAAELTDGADLVLSEWREGHWLFARQPIVHFGFSAPATVDKAVEWLRRHPQAFALIPAADLSRCFRPERAHQLGDTSRATWFLVGPEADNGQCRGELPARVYRFAWQSPGRPGGTDQAGADASGR